MNSIRRFFPQLFSGTFRSICNRCTRIFRRFCRRRNIRTFHRTDTPQRSLFPDSLRNICNRRTRIFRRFCRRRSIHIFHHTDTLFFQRPERFPSGSTLSLSVCRTGKSCNRRRRRIVPSPVRSSALRTSGGRKTQTSPPKRQQTQLRGRFLGTSKISLKKGVGVA